MYESPLVPSSSYFQSRNKAKLVVSGTINHPVIGLFENEILDCPLHTPEINNLAQALKPLIRDYRLQPYDIQTRRGELKYLIITHAQATQELMLRFVLRSPETLTRVKRLTRQLQADYPTLKVVSVNLQPTHTSIIEGPEEIVLSERKTIVDRLGNYNFVIGPRTFYQVNSSIALQLYLKAQEETKKIAPAIILDLFCGIGTFTQFCAAHASSSIGVELSTESIQYAHESAKLNAIHNCEFIAADVKKYLRNHLDLKPDLVIVNPPRRGLGTEIIDLLVNLRPLHIFYSSCNPETLDKDLYTLQQHYEVKTKTPFDMFPLSHHLEVFTVLRSRKNLR